MPKIIKMPKTKVDREAEKQRVKTLYYSGQSLSDAARAVGVTSDVARQWAVRDGWTQEIKETKALVQSVSQNVTPDKNIAFDFAATNKESRHLLAKGLNKAAKHIANHMLPEEMINAGRQVKAIVGSVKDVAGDWEDSSANRFAVSLSLNQVVQSGQIQEIPPGATIEYE